MTYEERTMVKKLMKIVSNSKNEFYVNSLKEEFLTFFTVDVTKKPYYVRYLLESAYNSKNDEDVEYALFIVFAFNLFSDAFLEILCNLIIVDWHFQHEDICLILQKIKSPNSVNALYKASLLNLEYLSYSDASPLARKCVWALGGIKTEESKEKLELLSKSDDELIRNTAKYQLENWIYQ